MISTDRFLQITNEFKNLNPILVVGDVGVDKYTLGKVTRISPEAPVPVVEVKKEWSKLGLAANVTDNLNSLEVKSTLCGVIGNDVNGELLESLLEESSQSTWGLVRCKSRMTTFKERVVTETQQVCRVDYETKELLSEETSNRMIARIKEFLSNHSSVILEDYGKGLFSEKFTKALIQEAKNLGIFIGVDPSRTTNPLIYKGVNLFKPNQVESEIIAKSLGCESNKIEDIANTLVTKLELDKLIITLGADGMAIFDKEDDFKLKKIPTVAREVFDVSGAGDTAISTIMSSLGSGATLEEAAWIGNFASGVVVGKKGTALVTPEELKNYFDSLK